MDDEARDVVPALPGDDPLPTMVDNAHDMPIESSTTAATPLPQISITGTGTNFLTQLSERLNRHHHHSHGIHHGAAGSSASLVSSNASTIPTRNPTRQSSFASGASGAATPSHAGAMLEDITVYTQNREDYELDAAAGRW